MSLIQPPTPAVEPLYGPAADAERMSALCYKSLKRAHERGEPVGLVKVGRATRFHLPTLRRWLDARAGVISTV